MKNATSRPTTLVLAAAWLYRGKLPPPQSTDTTLQSSTSYIPDIFIPLSYPSLPSPFFPSPSPVHRYYITVQYILYTRYIHSFILPFPSLPFLSLPLPSSQKLHYSPVHLIYKIYSFLYPTLTSPPLSFPLLSFPSPPQFTETTLKSSTYSIQDIFIPSLPSPSPS